MDFDLNKDLCGSPTRLYDKNGVQILFGSRVRFEGNDGCLWDSTIVFEDGVPTVSILSVTQIENPRDWDKDYDWIRSRWWSTLVGYGEFGSWNCPRSSLVQICKGFGSTQDDYKKRYKPMCEEYGYGKRYINAEVLFC